MTSPVSLNDRTAESFIPSLLNERSVSVIAKFSNADAGAPPNSAANGNETSVPSPLM